MNKWKKVGLTALAASLVSTSAFAGEMSVAGKAKVNYTSGAGDVGGNPFSSSETLTFSGGGDLDNGMTVDVSYSLLDGAATTASSVKLGMGDGGTLTFGVGISGGVRSYDGKVPSAGEEVWDDIGSGDDAGVVDIGADPSLYYSVNAAGINASASYARTGTGTENSIALVASELMDGAEFGIGTGTNVASATSEDDYTTVYGKYTSGAFTIGVQLSEIDKTAAASDVDREAAAISFAVNENLSISYGMSTVKYESSSKVDAESTGVSASYTMGGMTIGAVANKTDSFAGTSGTDKEFTEVSLSFAF